VKFRKLPVEIEAFQMTEYRRWDNSEWPNWLHEAWNKEPQEGSLWCEQHDGDDHTQLYLGTLEGVHDITFGDWIIRNVKGDLDACKPDIFSMTYERVDTDEPASDAGFHS